MDTKLCQKIFSLMQDMTALTSDLHSQMRCLKWATRSQISRVEERQHLRVLSTNFFCDNRHAKPLGCDAPTLKRFPSEFEDHRRIAEECAARGWGRLLIGSGNPSLYCLIMVRSAVGAHSFWMCQSVVFTKAKQQHEGPHTPKKKKQKLQPQDVAQFNWCFQQRSPSDHWQNSQHTDGNMLVIIWPS